MSVGVMTRAGLTGPVSGQWRSVCMCIFLCICWCVYVSASLSEGHSSGEHVQLDQTTACLHRPPGARSKFIHLTKHKTDIVRFELV